MDDLLTQLSSLLSGDDGQQMLQNAAKALEQGGGDLSSLLAGLSEPSSSPDPSDCKNTGENGSGDFGFDMNTILEMQRMMKLFQNQKDNKDAVLLNSLKPYLSDKRQSKVDEAIKMLKLVSMLPLLKESGILGGLK